MIYVIKNKPPIIANPGLSARLPARGAQAGDNAQAGKSYVFTIRDLPDEDKPREKLLALGPGALTPKELLAIVLEKGTRKEGVLAMTERIACEYGERSVFVNTDAKKLSDDLKIPLTKAMQIVAVGELGRRFFERSRNGAVVIRTAKEVFEYVADMRALTKEHLRGLYLNAHYQLIHDEIISIGTVDANVIHPREVFRPALMCSAVAVILVHNHPSGVLKPSADDARITKQIKEAGAIIGIELVDHIIIGKDGFASV